MLCEQSLKLAGPGSRGPLNFWELNANNSKTVKATEFKFYGHVSRDSPDMTPLKFFEKWAWSGSRDPLNIWAFKNS